MDGRLQQSLPDFALSAEGAKGSNALRWAVVAIFALASTWNYLDRSLLAASAPSIQSEFHLSAQDYGWLVSAFGLSYALASPFVGWFLDRVGLHAGIVCAVGLWSLATGLVGWSSTFAQLAGARIFLGIWESAGVPAAGKLNAMYLHPKHRATGAAVTQVGLTIGSVGAALLANAFSEWRYPFFVCGMLGLLWIPLWLSVKGSVSTFAPPTPRRNLGETIMLLRDFRLLRLSLGNILWMGIYTLSANWTTVFLVKTYHLTGAEANHFAWFPPIASTAGGFLGGWLSMRKIERGSEAVKARVSGIMVSSLGCLVMLAVPFMPTPLATTLALAGGYFWVTAGSVNMYTIPVDIWGGSAAGTAISALVFSYGVLQMGISPLIGWVLDHGSLAPVCWLVGVTPMLGWLVVRRLAASPK